MKCLDERDTCILTQKGQQERKRKENNNSSAGQWTVFVGQSQGLTLNNVKVVTLPSVEGESGLGEPLIIPSVRGGEQHVQTESLLGLPPERVPWQSCRPGLVQPPCGVAWVSS